MHRDQYRIIGQIQQDGSVEGGDSVNWMGHYIYLTNSHFPFVQTFEKGNGGYVRHPYPEMTNNGFGAYYKDPCNGCISRDQLTGIIAALIRQKEKKALIRAIKHHAHSLFLFAYNTIKNGEDPKTAKRKFPDITFANIWSMYMRGFGAYSWAFFPILCVLDLHLLIDSIAANLSSDNDKISFALRLLVANEQVRTPISWLAAKITNKNKLMKDITEYWSGWRDQPNFVALYKDKIDGL